MRSERRTVIMVALLTAVGAALRLVSLNTRGFWIDEAISVTQANRSLVAVIAKLAEGVHPPLFHVLLHYWIELFGTGEVPVRLFASVWGILAIPVAFWAGRAIFDRRTGVIAAGLTAFSPYLIWYSQEARMYSMMLFFGLLSVGFLTLAVRENRTRLWLGYAVFTFLGMFTHYFFSFLVLGEVLYFGWHQIVVPWGARRRDATERSGIARLVGFLRGRPVLVPWATTMLFLGGTFILWLSRSVFVPSEEGSTALVGSATGQGLGYGQVPPMPAVRFNDVGLVIVEMIAGFHSHQIMYSMVAMWPLMISLGLVAMDFLRPLSARALLLWAASGVLVLFALGQWQGQALASRYFIALAAPALLLIAGALSLAPRRSFAVIVGFGVSLCLVAWANQSYNPDNLVRFDNREAIEYVAENYQSADAIIYEPFYLDPLFDYYLPKEIPSFPFPQYGRRGVLRNGKVALGQDLDRVVGQSKRTWLILSFQDIPTLRGDAYNTTQWFLRNGFTIAENRQLNQVQVILFENQGYGPGFLLPGGV